MRTTLDLDDDLLREATNAVARGYLEKNEPVPAFTKTYVVEAALKALLREQASRRLARLFGTEPAATAPHRRRVRG
jgi:Arc/MetJ family transcription regulator